jgi:hypothetical protein
MRLPAMDKLSVSLFSVVLLVGVGFQTAAQQRILTSEAAKYVGKKATVCGQVASTNYAESNKGSPTFLNLDRGYPDQKFTVVIGGEDRHKFPKFPEAHYSGRKICVTGIISMNRGVAQTIVRDPSQITRDE